MGELKSQLALLILIFVVIYFSLIALEIFVSKKTKKRVYTLKESLASLSTGLIHKGITKLVPLGIQLSIWNWAFEHALIRWRPGLMSFILCFFAVDFFYYLQHRLNHEWDFFWSLHQDHHSSLELNLLAGVRVSWLTPVVAAFFMSPLCFFGFSPEYVLINLILVFYGQWWCHVYTGCCDQQISWYGDARNECFF